SVDLSNSPTPTEAPMPAPPIPRPTPPVTMVSALWSSASTATSPPASTLAPSPIEASVVSFTVTTLTPPPSAKVPLAAMPAATTTHLPWAVGIPRPVAVGAGGRVGAALCLRRQLDAGGVPAGGPARRPGDGRADADADVVEVAGSRDQNRLARVRR